MFNPALKEEDVEMLNNNIPVRVGSNSNGCLVFYLPKEKYGNKYYSLTVDHINEKFILTEDLVGNKVSPTDLSPFASIVFPSSSHGLPKEKVIRLRLQDFIAIVHDNGKLELPFPDFTILKNRYQEKEKVSNVVVDDAKAKKIEHEKTANEFDIHRAVKALNKLVRKGEITFNITDEGLIGYSKFVVPE